MADRELSRVCTSHDIKLISTDRRGNAAIVFSVYLPGWYTAEVTIPGGNMTETRRRFGNHCALAHAMLCGLIASTAIGQEIHAIGVLSGGNASAVKALDVAGLNACGYSGSAWGNLAIRWSTSDGLLNIHSSLSEARGISGDGSAIVGNQFIWRESTGALVLPSFPGGTGFNAYGISADGSIVVGYGGTPAGMRALRWHIGNPVEELGVVPGGTESDARAVSADGSVVVGYWRSATTARAFRWTQTQGQIDLGVLPGWEHSYAYAVSADGAYVAGEMATDDAAMAFRWHQEGGIELLGQFPDGTRSQAHAISADGSVVAGAAARPGYIGAMLWSETGGMVDLNDYLETLGVDLSLWHLTRCYAISADGTALGGEGFYNGSTQSIGFVVTGLPSLCLPTITDQPQGTSTCPGGTAILTVKTANAPGNSVQWRFNGVAIDTFLNPTAQTPTLIVTDVTLESIGAYDAVVTNSCGSVTSSSAELSICSADFDCSGFVDIEDFSSFVERFESGDDSADFDQSGFVDLEDFSAFVHAFEIGC